MKEKVSLVVEKELWAEFKKHCHEHGYSFSKRVEILVKNELEHKTRKDRKQQEIMDILAELVSEKALHGKEGGEEKDGGPTDLKSLTDRYFERKKQRYKK